MKTYVFLTNSITNMGGAQMLLRNKMADLENNGWNVVVFYYYKGNVLIPELKKFEGKYRIPELKNDFRTYTRREAFNAIERMALIIEDTTNVIIESDFYHFGYWGELLAKRVNGINLLFFITEDFKKLNSKEFSFLQFKQKRGEWLNHISIKKKFIGDYHFINEPSSYLFMPSYSNVTSVAEMPVDYDNRYPVITSLGRLEKPYVLQMVSEIIDFAEKNNQIVNLFFIGGSEFEIYLQKIKKLLAQTSKVIPYFWGYMYPIPQNILKLSDVGIAVSGSVKVLASLGIPTISISVEDYQPLGVYGYTTTSCLFRTDEPVLPLSHLLKEIIIDNKYKGMELHENDGQYDMYAKNRLLLDMLLENDRKYYDCYTITAYFKRIYMRTARVLKELLKKLLKR